MKWFAKFLLEGRVVKGLKKFTPDLLSSPSIMVKSWAKYVQYNCTIRLQGILKLVAKLVALGQSVSFCFLFLNLTHSLIHHFETIPDSKKMQVTTEMWLLKDFNIQIA